MYHLNWYLNHSLNENVHWFHFVYVMCILWYLYVYIYVSVVNEYTSHRHISILTRAFKQFPFPTAWFFPTSHFCHRFRLWAITFALCRSPFILPSDSAFQEWHVIHGWTKKRHDFSPKGKDRIRDPPTINFQVLSLQAVTFMEGQLLLPPIKGRAWQIWLLNQRHGHGNFQGRSMDVDQNQMKDPFLMHKPKGIQEFSIEYPNGRCNLPTIYRRFPTMVC